MRKKVVGWGGAMRAERRGFTNMKADEASRRPSTTPPAALPMMIPRLFEAAAAACWAMRAGLLEAVPVTLCVGVPEREFDTEGMNPGVVEALKLWVRLGVFDPEVVLDWVIVGVQVLEADAPAEGVRE